MKAIILAAGYATRLYPLTLNKAKPLLEIGGKTVIDHILDKIKQTDITETIVVTNDKFYKDFETWNPGVTVLNDGTKNEQDRLESIGDINFALKNVDEDFIIIAGDNLFTFDLNELLDFAKDKQYVITGRNLPSLEEAKKHGSIEEMDGTGRVIQFVEKPENPKTKLSAIMMYCFKKEGKQEIINYLETEYKKENPKTLIEWLTQKTEVYAWINDSTYFDIGDKEKLDEAERWVNEHTS
ncbi:nucleotidyltransferase family protein [Candidatus Woesearchaeota archaeon]|jgi:glucose-1-phosphate thymidylyltransferase|nr:nucleotidyltransferase family protein [Candidatus Woesearchaeota archaeon]MBT3304776.1 nucleotidyltransferase family protein [Candidatus Woesearchaeota archaeon]MBT4367888.1 nucleotidyltransferase family protein [Candidatus Woesearchaeota archaeon]MBT4712376.1 nucleotidyltransferase family protein [Candidatus Woesearchaeota archaeon]MBT6639288.1 nucleotidyltransferase family protein [Candidatus Woesearchaeota archaeon]